MPTIPPWINVQPSDFAAAGERGLSAGVQAASVANSARAERDRAALESRRINEQHAAEQASLAQAAQQFQEQAKMKKMELELDRQQQERNFLIQQQRTQIADAYHTAVVGLQTQKLKNASEAAAIKYAAQQKLSALIQSGVPFDQAIIQVPELMGAGVETLLTKTATTGPGVSRMSDIDKRRYDAAVKEMNAQQKILAGSSRWFSKTRKPATEAIKKAQETLDEIGKKYVSPGGGAASGATHVWNPTSQSIEPIQEKASADSNMPAEENPYAGMGLPVSSGFMYTGPNAEVPAQ